MDNREQVIKDFQELILDIESRLWELKDFKDISVIYPDLDYISLEMEDYLTQVDNLVELVGGDNGSYQFLLNLVSRLKSIKKSIENLEIN